MPSINDMLTKLAVKRQSITKQIADLNEVLEKSNNVLLQLESARPTLKEEFANSKILSYQKDTEHTLAKIIELYPQLPQCRSPNKGVHSNDENLSFTEYLDQHCQNIQHLSSNVRKLLVVGDVLNISTVEQSNTNNESNQ